MKKIGVLTSGGDAPGMNAAIRAVVRTGVSKGIQVVGVIEGFNGLTEGKFQDLGTRDVSNILQRGGTILKSAKSKAFRTTEGRKQAFENVKKEGLEGLIVIGGNGSFAGASIFYNEYAVPYIGIPGTIDNDLFGTDFTLGFDTACNTVIEAVDRVKDTAASHNRLFFIEVMGRDSGYIALTTGIATGAEEILLPETATNVDDLIARLEKAQTNRKNSSIVIVAEGDDGGGAYAIAEKVKEKYIQYDTRVTILGHVQRGGRPSAIDRVLWCRFGHAAFEAILATKSDIMVGVLNNEIIETPVSDTISKTKPLPQHLFHIKEDLTI